MLVGWHMSSLVLLETKQFSIFPGTSICSSVMICDTRTRSLPLSLSHTHTYTNVLKTVLDELAGEGVEKTSQERLSGSRFIKSLKPIHYGNISTYNTWANYWFNRNKSPPRIHPFILTHAFSPTSFHPPFFPNLFSRQKWVKRKSYTLR